tara:strand:+ start:1272 stop:1715 length:444 start_codon:yes stop_codon:yes gene_type:complete
MPTNIYTAGLNNVGSYQVSGAPFLTASRAPASASNVTANALKISFPQVTKEITVNCLGANGKTSGAIKVAFSSRGLYEGGHANHKSFIIVPVSSSVTLDVKATELYIMSFDSDAHTFSLFASLTNLPVERVNNIVTDTNWSGSTGVG